MYLYHISENKLYLEKFTVLIHEAIENFAFLAVIYVYVKFRFIFLENVTDFERLGRTVFDLLQEHTR